MPRKKKTAVVAEKAEHRLAGMKAIDPQLDLGEGCNVSNLQSAIEELREKITTYNEALSVIDSTTLDIKNLEKQLKQLNQKALLGIAFKYGKNSEQYALAGGVKTSDVVRRRRASLLKAKEDANQ